MITISPKGEKDDTQKNINQLYQKNISNLNVFNVLFDTRKATGLTPNEVENLDWNTGWMYYQRYTLDKIFNQ